MAKIPFNIKYRPQIESGEYKVETMDGKPVRIICWDMDSYNPIVALVANYPNYNGSLSEHVFSYSIDGHYNTICSSDEDLFIITPEEEMTEFEKALITFYDTRSSMNCDNLPEDREEEILTNHLHKSAAKLLELARKELQPEIDAYASRAEAVFREGYEKGKAEALKDLPRWRKYSDIGNRGYGIQGGFVIDGDWLIALEDLEKLPGFKEN